MKKMRILCVVLCVLFAASSAQAFQWTGAGATDYWSDAANWDDGLIPLTGGVTAGQGIVHSVIDPATVVTIQAATSNTFVAGTTGVWLYANTAGRSTTLNVDWGSTGFTTPAWNYLAKDAYGAATVNHTGGSITTAGGTWARGSKAGASLDYNLSGGSHQITANLNVGARADCLGDVTLDISGTGSFLTNSGNRVYGGGREGATGAIKVSGSGTLVAADFRGDQGGGDVSMGTGGHSLFEVTGSSATVSFINQFETESDYVENLSNIYRFVADAGGVSTITGTLITSNLKIHPHSDLEIDLTGYAGTDDLDLFLTGKYNGGTWDTITITDPLARGYVYVQDFDGSSVTSDAIDIRSYLTIPEPATMALLALGGLFLRRRK